MCSECGMLYCPPGCPGADEPTLPRCSECNAELYPEEVFKMPDGKIFCPYCLDNMELADILRICEISDVKMLLNLVSETVRNHNKGV